MADFYSGAVFDVGRGGSTRGMSVDSFMRAMGAINSPEEEVDFQPIKGMDEVLQTNTPDHDAYVSSLRSANDFGMRMAAKGIDILNPKTEEEARASTEFNRLWQNATKSGNAIRAGHEIAKLYTQQRLKDGVFGQALPKNKTYTMEDLQSLVNTNPFAKQLNDSVDEINQMARTYSTQAQTDQANHLINTQMAKIDELKSKMEQSGVPDNIASFLAENAKNSINKATHDPTDEQKLKIQAQRARSQNAVDAARAAKLRAETAKTGGKGKEELMIQRKRLIQAIQQGDARYIGSLSGGKIGKSNISNIDVERDATGNITGIIINKTDDPVKKMNESNNILIPFGPDNNYGWAEINNILNTTPGAEKYSFEDLSSAPDPPDAEVEPSGISKAVREIERTLAVKKVPQNLYPVIDAFYDQVGRIPTLNEYQKIVKKYGK